MARFDPRSPTPERVEQFRADSIREFSAIAERPARGWAERERAEKAAATVESIRRAPVEQVAALLAQRIAKESADRAHQWERLMRSRPRYAECSFANFVATTDAQVAALARVKRFAENLEDHVAAGVNVILHGPCGTGKDHLMTALMRVVVWEFENHPRIHLFDGVTLAARAKNDRGKPLDDIFAENHETAPQILAISDPVMVGETAKFYQMERLTELIDGQYRTRRPVWVTVNAATRDELYGMLTPPLADRLVDGAFTLFTDWPSFRRKGEFA